jgi:hypothetical protein
MTEAHPGFKVFAWHSDGYCWVATIHQGTGGSARLCVRHHTVGLAAWNRSGTKVLDMQFMADFGEAVDNQNHSVSIVTSACRRDSPGDSHGVRQISVVASGGTGYEPWRIDAGGNVLGLVNDFNVNTFDPVTKCDVANPCTLVTTGESGTKHQFPGSGWGIGRTHPSGTFCTNPTATKVITCGAAGAVRQYIAAGFTATVGVNKVIDFKGWGLPGIPTEGDLPNWDPTERENSIKGAN